MNNNGVNNNQINPNTNASINQNMTNTNMSVQQIINQQSTSNQTQNNINTVQPLNRNVQDVKIIKQKSKLTPILFILLLLLGAYTRKNKEEIQKDLEEVYEWFPRLNERRKQLAGTLSGGEQQMLAMGRALMAKPKIMLLDEPSMGLSPLLVKEIFHIIEEINKKGTTIFLVEQNAKMALAIANRAYVLETGKITLEGTGAELSNDARVQKAYLGG